jgi:hypothetical protein
MNRSAVGLGGAASRFVFSHCVRARREFAPAGDSLWYPRNFAARSERIPPSGPLLVQRKEAKKAPQFPSGCLQCVSAEWSTAVLTQQLASRLKQRDLSLEPHTSADRGVLHRSTWRQCRPAATRMVSLKTKVQPSSQPRQTVQGPPPFTGGAVKYAWVQGGMRPQAKVALFEPRGELLRKHGRGARSRHALVTPGWVFRCFLCLLSLHQQRKKVAGRGEYPAGSHAVRNHNARSGTTVAPGAMENRT